MPHSKFILSKRRWTFVQVTTCIALAVLASACASLSRQPETGRPRPNEPAYPVMLATREERRERVLGVWASLIGEQAVAAGVGAPELQPVTATVRALPSMPASASLRLPLVGGEAQGTSPTEEETRESLRRFITGARVMLGVAPEDLSLVERVDTPNGTKRARYRQTPFRYPLRAGYGLLDIEWMPADRRIVALSSTALPVFPRIERAMEALRPAVTPQDVVTRLAGRSIAYTDAGGREQSLNVTATNETTVRELVVYPQTRADDPTMLAIHLAWEVSVGGANVSPLMVYVDALTGDIIAATPTNAIPPTTSPTNAAASPAATAPTPVAPGTAPTP
ncbi:MAG TPA: hypothetical protein VF666_15560 [Pyrinomonadaceae bacterium]|jgi:hypothetical protein